MDETRRNKPVRAQNVPMKRWELVYDRWHTDFVDAAGTGGLLPQLEGRSAAATIAWLNAQPAAWRAGITHVTIDLSSSYAKTTCDALPDAVLVADRYRLVALANDMLTQVRSESSSKPREGSAARSTWPGRRVTGC